MPGVGGEVAVDEGARLVAGDARPSGQPEVAHPVGDPEVDHLGHGALVGRHVRRVLAQHERSAVAVDVPAFREGGLQVGVARNVGQDPELDLAVVGAHEDHLGRAGNEGPPDAPAERRPDRDVLEVRVRRREAARRGHGLVERRMEPPVGGQEPGQRLDVGGAQLGVEPPVEELANHRMGRPQLLEDGRVGGVAGLRPLPRGQVQLVEEDLLQLLGAPEVELVAHVGVDLRLKAGQLGLELAVESGEGVEVEGDAGRLHPGQDRDERQLQLGEQAVEALLFEGGREGAATASAESASSAARSPGVRPAAAGGRSMSSRSCTTSAIPWLRSAALRR